MNYIGFANEIKESSVSVVLNDGSLKWVFTEERYSRKKYDNNFPFNSIKNLSHYIDRDLFLNYNEEDKDRTNIFKAFFPNITIKKISNCYHHLLHCYETFYTSGFNRAAVLVVDGFGDNDGEDVESISLYHKIGRETNLLKRYYFKDSLGAFYGNACFMLGFNENEEGHFMGLSSYGKPFDNRYAKFNKEKFEIRKFNKMDKYTKNNKDLDCLNNINFAATVQRDLVECLLGLVKYIKELTGEDNLCLSGGVFNNVLANNAICESGIFKNIWCTSAPGDYGISVGHAYLAYEKNTADKDMLFKRMDNAYLGEEYTDNDIIKFLSEKNISYTKVNSNDIADLLVNDKIIVWFQGRSEYGRRALGHRSILSNPLYRNNYIRVSQNIKNRAPYRPLACTVPDELFDVMFNVKNKDLTELMLRAIEIRKDIRERVPACCAIDNTTRPQNLHRYINPELYDMIMNFYKKTGVPCVINTSLNGGGEPIVESLNDLGKFIIKQNEKIPCKIDYIVLNGKYLIDCVELYKLYAKKGNLGRSL